MRNWKHFNFEQRKIITSMLSNKSKLVEIAKILDVDPTSISKEIKRNRILTKKASPRINKECKYILRYPYCCNSCQLKYTTCLMYQYKYEARNANEKADYRLVNTRVGLNMTEDEFKVIDQVIKEGVDNSESIYHIVKSHPEITISVSSIYRLINENKLSTKRMDLPYAVTYKKRKAKSKEYEYKENRKIDRSGRTYLDFLIYKRTNPGLYHVQMDFLGAIKGDKKNILTVTIPDIHFVLLFLVENKNAERVVKIFNNLEYSLGLDFCKVFPYILTDRDPCFQNFFDIEASFLNNLSRTKVFYCDSFNSCQKGSVENMNKQLRKFFPKGKSIDNYTAEDVKIINNNILNARIASLNGETPKNVFVGIFGKTIFTNLFK